ncbi:type II toxin-antitoxin system RelE/ParE family toxin [Dokdonia sinensis]|uniref:Type II toxin-antitoxin system RelE/ParE family toxin n=1 Tax=Dokdonia sinensis TaxID=2479847 RepID=A0A3M0FUR5_9FLAO|nr:type II toxin-antitoxin system RelE/ParE family toxin [Dokdonia sinensis]RMB56434.1 type II toxin-antitoxin system RelE/ParE family toxin [Dokdonia sinensis]
MSDFYKVIWLPQALEDYHDTLSDLELYWTSEIVMRLALEVEKTLDLLEQNPHIFQVADEAEDIRRAVVLKLNKIYYRINSDRTIDILSFFPSRNDPNDLTLK